MKDSLRASPKAFTLIELIIALSLVGMIVLAIVAVDVGSRGFLKTADKEAKTQNDINFAFEKVAKDIRRSYRGSKSNPSVKISPARLEVRMRKGPDDAILSDDTWVAYDFNNNKLDKIECSAISSDGKNCDSWAIAKPIINGVSNWVFSADDEQLITLSITALADNTKPQSPDNPEIVLSTSVFGRGYSQ